MTKQSFLRGTFILILAGLLTRVLGFVNRIVMARILGEEGVGLYMMAVPTFILAITITQLGLPVAIAKLIAEAEAVGNKQKVQKVLTVSLTVTLTLSVILTAALIVAAPILSRTMLTDQRTYYPLIAILPVVPIIAVSSVLRGYFQGKQNMKPSSFAQVLEQVVRITLIAVCIRTFLPFGVEYAAAGAMLSAVAGELASLLYMFIMFKKEKQTHLSFGFARIIREGQDTFYSLMRIGLPTTGSRFIGSISYFMEPIVVAQSLAAAGITAAIATKQYGELTGYALPLLFLPSFITYALSTSLVPAISEAMAKKQYRLVEYRMQQSMRLSMVSGGWATVILYVFASPLLMLMYGTDHAVMFIKILAPLSILYYFQGPLTAALQALDLAKAAMFNSLIGSIVKIIVIVALASRPEFQIMGVAIAIAVGFITVTLLHFATVLKRVQFTIYLREYLYELICIALSGYTGWYLYNEVVFSASLSIQTLCSILITSLVYFLLLITFSLIKKEELQRLPLIRKLSSLSILK
ncbi:stage V sporulation protein B [Bacillus sp. 165]|uniref:stage V sporulation protein B n=1 Tax=Bacillus sp. 165 TaxID=1529117 RepID=UPI001ADC676D|nr:stage V sporulation protein B [Bacillus sp. 165]MBO9130475.1 stage V sporulation protein B [Bacillus sp. 165]